MGNKNGSRGVTITHFKAARRDARNPHADKKSRTKCTDIISDKPKQAIEDGQKTASPKEVDFCLNKKCLKGVKIKGGVETRTRKEVTESSFFAKHKNGYTCSKACHDAVNALEPPYHPMFNEDEYFKRLKAGTLHRAPHDESRPQDT